MYRRNSVFCLFVVFFSFLERKYVMAFRVFRLLAGAYLSQWSESEYFTGDTSFTRANDCKDLTSDVNLATELSAEEITDGERDIVLTK